MEIGNQVVSAAAMDGFVEEPSKVSGQNDTIEEAHVDYSAMCSNNAIDDPSIQNAYANLRNEELYNNFNAPSSQLHPCHLNKPVYSDSASPYFNVSIAWGPKDLQCYAEHLQNQIVSNSSVNELSPQSNSSCIERNSDSNPSAVRPVVPFIQNHSNIRHTHLEDKDAAATVETQNFMDCHDENTTPRTNTALSSYISENHEELCEANDRQAVEPQFLANQTSGILNSEETTDVMPPTYLTNDSNCAPVPQNNAPSKIEDRNMTASISEHTPKSTSSHASFNPHAEEFVPRWLANEKNINSTYSYAASLEMPNMALSASTPSPVLLSNTPVTPPISTSVPEQTSQSTLFNSITPSNSSVQTNFTTSKTQIQFNNRLHGFTSSNSYPLKLSMFPSNVSNSDFPIRPMSMYNVPPPPRSRQKIRMRSPSEAPPPPPFPPSQEIYSKSSVNSLPSYYCNSNEHDASISNCSSQRLPQIPANTFYSNSPDFLRNDISTSINKKRDDSISNEYQPAYSYPSPPLKSLPSLENDSTPTYLPPNSTTQVCNNTSLQQSSFLSPSSIVSEKMNPKTAILTTPPTSGYGVWETLQSISPAKLNTKGAIIVECSGSLYAYGRLVQNCAKNLLYVYEDLGNQQHRWNRVRYTGSPPLYRGGMDALSSNGRIYIFGGRTVYGIDCFSLYEFDQKDQNWIRHQLQHTNELPIKRQDYSIVMYKQQLFIFGGVCMIKANHKWQFHNDLWCMDLTQCKWKQLGSNVCPSQPSNLKYYQEFSFCTCPPNPMYQSSLPGSTSTLPSESTSNNSLVTINPISATNLTTSLYTSNGSSSAPLCSTCNGVIPSVNRSFVPSGRAGHTAVIYQSSMFVFGGTNAQEELGDFYEYEIEEDRWEKVVAKGGVSPVSRYCHSANVIGDRMIILGGFGGKHSFLSGLHEFNFITHIWSGIEEERGIAPSPRFRHLTAFHQGYLYVFGGKCNASLYHDGQYPLSDKEIKVQQNIAVFTDTYRIKLVRKADEIPIVSEMETAASGNGPQTSVSFFSRKENQENMPIEISKLKSYRPDVETCMQPYDNVLKSNDALFNSDMFSLNVAAQNSNPAANAVPVNSPVGPNYSGNAATSGNNSSNGSLNASQLYQQLNALHSRHKVCIQDLIQKETTMFSLQNYIDKQKQEMKELKLILSYFIHTYPSFFKRLQLVHPHLSSTFEKLSKSLHLPPANVAPMMKATDKVETEERAEAVNMYFKHPSVAKSENADAYNLQNYLSSLQSNNNPPDEKYQHSHIPRTTQPVSLSTHTVPSPSTLSPQVSYKNLNLNINPLSHTSLSSYYCSSNEKKGNLQYESQSLNVPPKWPQSSNFLLNSTSLDLITSNLSNSGSSLVPSESQSQKRSSSLTVIPPATIRDSLSPPSPRFSPYSHAQSYASTSKPRQDLNLSPRSYFVPNETLLKTVSKVPSEVFDFHPEEFFVNLPEKSEATNSSVSAYNNSTCATFPCPTGSKSKLPVSYVPPPGFDMPYLSYYSSYSNQPEPNSN